MLFPNGAATQDKLGSGSEQGFLAQHHFASHAFEALAREHRLAPLLFVLVVGKVGGASTLLVFGVGHALRKLEDLVFVDGVGFALLDLLKGEGDLFEHLRTFSLTRHELGGRLQRGG